MYEVAVKMKLLSRTILHQLFIKYLKIKPLNEAKISKMLKQTFGVLKPSRCVQSMLCYLLFCFFFLIKPRWIISLESIVRFIFAYINMLWYPAWRVGYSQLSDIADLENNVLVFSFTFLLQFTLITCAVQPKN